MALHFGTKARLAKCGEQLKKHPLLVHSRRTLELFLLAMRYDNDRGLCKAYGRIAELAVRRDVIEHRCSERSNRCPYAAQKWQRFRPTNPVSEGSRCFGGGAE